MNDDEMGRAIELAQQYAASENLATIAAYDNAIVLARALLASHAELERMRRELEVLRGR